MDLHAILKQVVEHKASDAHFKTGHVPTVRLANGSLFQPINVPKLTENDVSELVKKICNQKKLDELERENEVDVSYDIEGLSRFRINVYTDYKNFRIDLIGILTEKTIEITNTNVQINKEFNKEENYKKQDNNNNTNNTTNSSSFGPLHHWIKNHFPLSHHQGFGQRRPRHVWIPQPPRSRSTTASDNRFYRTEDGTYHTSCIAVPHFPEMSHTLLGGIGGG